MFRKACLFVAVVAAVVILGACATFGTYETAQTTARGKFGFGGAITPVHVSGDTNGISSQLLPLPEISGKLGVSDNFELGARWGFGPGMTLTGKYCFRRGPLDAALVTYGSLYGMAMEGVSLWIYGVNPRVIVSREAADVFPFSASAGLGFSGVGAGVEGQTASGSVLSAVAGFGLPFRVGEQRDVRFMPEVSLSLPIVSSFQAGGSTGTTSLLGSYSMSLGVGFGFAPQPATLTSPDWGR